MDSYAALLHPQVQAPPPPPHHPLVQSQPPEPVLPGLAPPAHRNPQPNAQRLAVPAPNADALLDPKATPPNPPLFQYQPQSRLLSLPGELRNEIYGLLLGNPSSLHPAILSTCRQTFTEATPLLYAHTFTAHPSLLTSLPSLARPPLSATMPAPAYPPILSAPAAAYIRRWKLTLRIDIDPRFSAEQARAAFSGCESLEIEVRQSSWGDCPVEPALALFGLVRGVKKVVIRGVGEEGEGFKRVVEGLMMSKEVKGVPGLVGGTLPTQCGEVRCRRCGFVDVLGLY